MPIVGGDADARRHAEVIRQHFPEVAATQIQALPHRGWGGASDAYLVGGHLVFRFPRSKEVARSTAAEIRLLSLIGDDVGLPIPRFQYVILDPDDGLPVAVVYEAIRGEPLSGEQFGDLVGSGTLSIEEVAQQLASFLSGLHSFPVEAAIACGVPGPEGSPRADAERRFAAVRRRVYPALDDDERAWLTRAFEEHLADSRRFALAPALCHGDLTSDHLLFDTAQRQLGGVIDFGDAQVGDRAADFVWRYEYGEDLFQAVLASYRLPVGDQAVFAKIVAFRHALMPTFEIAYGLETSSRDLVEEGRRDLRVRMSGLSPIIIRSASTRSWPRPGVPPNAPSASQRKGRRRR